MELACKNRKKWETKHSQIWTAAKTLESWISISRESNWINYMVPEEHEEDEQNVSIPGEALGLRRTMEVNPIPCQMSTECLK
jgi:hypothetical protein